MDKLRRNPIDTINKIIYRFTDAWLYEDKLERDLQSTDKIGEGGQRIGLFFADVREDYPVDERLPALDRLLSVEDDIKRAFDSTHRKAFLGSGLGACILYDMKVMDRDARKLVEDISKF